MRRHGDQVGATCPAVMMARMGFKEGQQLTLVKLADGVELVRHDPVLERQIALAHETLREEADTLRELAKR